LGILDNDLAHRFGRCREKVRAASNFCSLSAD
jgi:hypothetical protein